MSGSSPLHLAPFSARPALKLPGSQSLTAATAGPPLSDSPIPLRPPVCVFAQELVCFTVNLCRVRLLSRLARCLSPFLLHSCLHVCISLKIDLVLFVTGLHVSRVSQFATFFGCVGGKFTVDCKIQGPRMLASLTKRRRNGSQAAASDHIMLVVVLFRLCPDGSLSLSLLTSWIYRCVGDVRAANTLLSIPVLTAA